MTMDTNINEHNVYGKKKTTLSTKKATMEMIGRHTTDLDIPEGIRRTPKTTASSYRKEGVGETGQSLLRMDEFVIGGSMKKDGFTSLGLEPADEVAKDRLVEGDDAENMDTVGHHMHALKDESEHSSYDEQWVDDDADDHKMTIVDGKKSYSERKADAMLKGSTMVAELQDPDEEEESDEVVLHGGTTMGGKKTTYSEYDEQDFDDEEEEEVEVIMKHSLDFMVDENEEMSESRGNEVGDGRKTVTIKKVGTFTSVATTATRQSVMSQSEASEIDIEDIIEVMKTNP